MKLRQLLKKNATLRIARQKFLCAYNRLRYTDEQFICKEFKKKHGFLPNLKNPITYSEKLVWSSLNYRNNLYTKLVDKYLVREFVKEKIGEQYLLKLFGVYYDVKDIKYEDLPQQFVLNTNHGSNWIIICSDKQKLDFKYSLKLLKGWMSINFFYYNREWPYKYVKPCILCEEYIGTEDGTPPLDYKFMCFGGEPKFIEVDSGRFKQRHRNVYDLEWNSMPVRISCDPNPEGFKKPEKLDEMIDIAKKLSEGFEHVRVDFYYVKGKIYFGELTFYQAANGTYSLITPKSFDEEIGRWYKLPEKNIDTYPWGES